MGAPSFSGKESRKAPTRHTGHLPLVLRFNSRLEGIKGSVPWGQFLILSTPRPASSSRPASSGDTRDGSDNRASNQGVEPRGRTIEPRGRFLILATLRPASSGDIRDGSDIPASDQGVSSRYCFFPAQLLPPAQLPPAIQEMVQISPRAHRQTFGDPPHRHRRLRPQARRQSHLH